MPENTRSIDRMAKLVLILGMAFVLAPIAIAVLTATQSLPAFIAAGGIGLRLGDDFLENLRRVLTETLLPRQLWNSFLIALLVAGLKCGFAFLATFALVFYRNRTGSLVFALAMITVMLPLELLVITTYRTVANVAEPLNWFMAASGIGPLWEWLEGARPEFRLNLLGTPIGIAAPIATSSVAVFIFRQFFLSLPRDLAKAAVMDGAGPIRFMLDVLLPLSRAPLATTFLIGFVNAWTYYLWPLVAAFAPETQTATVGLAMLIDNDPARMPDVPLLMTGALVVSFFPVLLIALVQPQILRGFPAAEE